MIPAFFITLSLFSFSLTLFCHVFDFEDLYIQYFYISICVLSLNVNVHLYIMLNYNVQALTESIFPEVRSIVRDNRSPNILWHCPLSQIMEQECPFHKSHQLQGDRTLCCCSYHQSSRTLYHLCSCKKNLKKNQTKRNPKTTR